ncbi:MAG: hypothetical protein IJ003_06635 [Candidatus Gastranaerophilales bacterium]|nr:hypothetical protein [Candidatus Gastranaerophilales bacterium]
MNNKFLLKSLEKISDHPASFCAGASFICATTIKPLSILLTPKTDKENKKTFSIEAFSSAFIKLLTTSAVTIPIEKIVNKISKNPQEFLKKETLEKLKNAKDFNFLTQIIKQGANIITAIPKSMLTVALIPILNSILFKEKKENKDNILKETIKKENNPNFIAFNGNINKKTTDFISSLINNKTLQNFATKNSKNDKNLAKATSVATDIVLAGSSVLSINSSKKIDKKNKKPLMINKIVSTGISIITGCIADSLIQNNTKNFIEKFITANKNNPKLPKYIEGINILRPTIVFALIYYGLIPMISTYTSDKLSKVENKN